jgi:hypothetical protein
MRRADNSRLRRQRRDRMGCRGEGSGPRRHIAGQTTAGGGASLSTRTAMRTALAAGAYVAHDMRDRNGLARPMLRRAALRLAVSPRPALRRLGGAYLRADPPAAEELSAAQQTQWFGRGALPASGGSDQVIDLDPSQIVEIDADGAI